MSYLSQGSYRRARGSAKSCFITVASSLAICIAIGMFAQRAWSQDSPSATTRSAASEIVRVPDPGTCAEGKCEPLSLPQVAILGVVEGLTEYLPVSSTGHMILTNYFLGDGPDGLLQYKKDPQTGKFERSPLGGRMLDKEKMAAVDSFEIVIQLGAILAVVGLYRKRVGQMCRGLTGKDPQGLRLVTLLFIAFLPAAVIGLATHKTIEKYLFGPVPVTYALAAGGILMILVEYFFWIRRRDSKRVTQVDQVAYWQAAVIGCAQVLAMWPGTSRSMVTMLAALVVGLDMVAAAEFSFLLALPTLGAATLYSAHRDWGSLTQAVGPAGMILGLVVSAVVAAITVKGFVRWLTRHGLYPFGIYRLLAAIVMFWLLAR